MVEAAWDWEILAVEIDRASEIGPESVTATTSSSIVRSGLEVGEDSKFTWAAIPDGQQRVTITGQVATTGDSLMLESPDQGTMVGRVESGGPDKFQFILAGGPPDDEGLSFERVKE